jgi:hypothetical protein
VDSMVIRLLILTAQYRKPIDFTPTAIASNEASWQTLKTGLLFGEQFGDQLGWQAGTPVVAVNPEPAENRSLINPVLIDETPLAPFRALPANASSFAQENRGLVVFAVLLFFTQFPIKFLARFLYTFNTVPVLPEFFKLLGVALVARTILFKKPREQFFGWARWAVSYLFPPSQPENAVERFRAIVDEDFNFAGGLAVLFDLAKSLGKQANILSRGGQATVDGGVLKEQWETLVELAGILGLEAQMAAISEGISDSQIAALVAQRQVAKDAKNWAEADRIRADLKAQGIELVDKKGSQTTWLR